MSELVTGTKTHECESTELREFLTEATQGIDNNRRERKKMRKYDAAIPYIYSSWHEKNTKEHVYLILSFQQLSNCLGSTRLVSKMLLKYPKF